MENNKVVSVNCVEKDNVYTNSALIACLVSNDLKHIHLHSCGSQFDRIHDIAQEYYDKVSEELDYLCELALEFGEDLPNLTQAGSIMTEYSIETDNKYDYDYAISEMSSIISTYINWLCVAKDYSEDHTDVQSYLDDEIRYWSKELNYKLSRRSNCCDNCNSDYYDDCDYVDTSNIIDVTETTQSGSIGQHKDTNTNSFPPINKNKRKHNKFNKTL